MNDRSPEADAEIEDASKEEYSYDVVPYRSHAFTRTHPDRLAVIARWFGVPAKPVDAARVLELGCASGGNLTPMACQLPGSSFVGVDLSAKQIDQARQTVEKLKLDNVEFRHADLMDIDASWGKFDYIISHGVYSWVSETVRNKIMEVTRSNLADNGVGYVSYNTYPGWHMRSMIRQMMMYHIGQFSEPDQKIEQSRALLKFLVESVPEQDNPHGMIMKRELDQIRHAEDSYFFHDHLEEVNEPVYFYQFAESANRHNLQYLGEVSLGNMLALGFSQQVQDTLTRISPDIIRREQYMDFLRNRFFRESLVCRRELSLQRNLHSNQIADFLIRMASPLREVPQLSASATLKVNKPGGSSLTVTNVVTQSALITLNEALPNALAFEDVKDIAIESIAGSLPETDTTNAEQILHHELFQLYIAGIVELCTWQPELPAKDVERPVAFPLALLQLKEGKQRVVNQRHQYVKLNPVARAILPLLDGSRGREELTGVVTGKIGRRTFEFRAGPESTPWVPTPAQASQLVEQTLDVLWRSSLLVS